MIDRRGFIRAGQAVGLTLADLGAWWFVPCGCSLVAFGLDAGIELTEVVLGAVVGTGASKVKERDPERTCPSSGCTDQVTP